MTTRPSVRIKQWTCTACGLAVAKDAIVKNTAEIIEGQLFCAYCIAQQRKKEQKAQRKRRTRTAIIATAVFVAVVALLWTYLSHRAQQQKQRDVFTAKAQRIIAELKENRYVAACVLSAELQAELGTASELFDPQGAQQLLEKPQREADRWLNEHFPETSAQARPVLTKLLGLFPGPESDLGRIFDVQIEEGLLAVKAAGCEYGPTELTTNTDKPGTDAQIDEASAFIKLLTDIFPQYSSFELTWFSAREQSVIGTYRITRAQLLSLPDTGASLRRLLEGAEHSPAAEAPDQAGPPPSH